MTRTAQPIGFGLLLLLSASDARADTLVLQDGNKMKGTYAGGDATTVHFDISGQILKYQRDKVVSLTFERPPPKPAPAAAPAGHVSGATLPKGVKLHVKLTKGISSGRAAAGLPFEGVLETGVQVDNRVLLPAGAKVYGKTVNVKKGRRLAGRAELGLTLDALMAGAVRVTVATSSAQFVGERQGTAKKVAVGAALGAAFGGKKGAKYGAASGGALAVLSPGKQVNIPPGTILDFELAQPVKLP